MVMLSESLEIRQEKGRQGSLRFGGSALSVADPRGIPGWNRLCEAHPDGSVFHSTRWLNVLAETYNLAPSGAILGEGSQPAALFPFFEVSRFGARKAVCLPFTDFCEPLVWDSAGAEEAIGSELLKLGKARRWTRLEVRGGKALAAGQLSALEFYGHVLDLTPGETRLFAGFEPGVRQAIRKAEREGVKVEISAAAEAVKEYYTLHCRTRKRHGLPPQPYRLFRKIHEHLIEKGGGMTVVARYQEKPVAGGMFMSLGTKGLFKFGASDRRFQSLRANDLVMWTAIRELAGNGLASLHFGRTSLSNEGLRRFKLGWGATESRIRYLTYDFLKSAFVVSRDRAFGWHNRLFRAMPMWVARMAGSLLYKRFA